MIQKHLATLFFVAAALETVHAQGPGGTGATSACNDKTRKLLVKAEATQTTVKCGGFSFTIDVGGVAVKVQSPTECVTSITTHSGDTFGCDDAYAKDLHCNPCGDTITVQVAVNSDPCPKLPATLPTTLKEAQALMKCGSLAAAEPETNCSATVKECKTGGSPLPRADGEIVDSNGDVFTVSHGDPAPLLAGPVPNDLLSTLESLQTISIGSLPAPLSAAATLAPRIAGVKDLQAVVSLQGIGQDGALVLRERYRIEGRVASDGRFSVTKAYRANDENGDSQIVVDELAFDGASLFWRVRGGLNGNVWGSTHPAFGAVISLHAGCVRSLVAWAYNPYWITRFPGVTHSVVHDTTTPVWIVTESYPGMFADLPAGVTRYFISDADPAHTSSVETLDADGALLEKVDYSDFRQLAPGVWRPFTIVEQRFEGLAPTPTTVVTTVITSASLATDGEFGDIERPLSGPDYWFVRH